MAYNPHSILFVIFIVFSIVGHTLVAREIPTDSKNVVVDDKKQPDSFIEYDRSVLIPGVGRVMIPDFKKGFNPFTYNPVTGTNGGTGTSIPTPSTGTSSGGSYVPGGDDTLVPNPGVEVPSGGGGLPSPASP